MFSILTLGRRAIPARWLARTVRPAAPAANPSLPLRTDTARIYATSRVSRATLTVLATSPDRPLTSAAAHVVQTSSSRTVAHTQLPLMPQVRVAYKQHRPRTWWKRAVAPLRPNRACREWALGQKLLACGIATPEPLVAIAPRGYQWQGASYVATRWIEGAVSLHEYWQAIATREPHERIERTRQCAEALGALIARLHAVGYAHGDLKGLNLLIVEHADRVQPFVVDLAELRRYRAVPYRQRLQNLARLAVSIAAVWQVTRADYRRFLRSYYLNTLAITGEVVDVRRIWHDVQRPMRKIVRLRTKLGRSLA